MRISGGQLLGGDWPGMNDERSASCLQAHGHLPEEGPVAIHGRDPQREACRRHARGYAPDRVEDEQHATLAMSPNLAARADLI
jgi:hypothetical protein